MSNLTAPPDEEAVREFLEESAEILEAFDVGLLALEGASAPATVLKGLFRNLHNLKGTCGWLGFGRLEALAHAGEDLLDALSAHPEHVPDGVVQLLLELGDTLRATVRRIASTGGEGPEDHEALVRRLRQTAEQSMTARAAPAGPARSGPSPGAAQPALPTSVDAAPAPGLANDDEAIRETSIRVDVDVLDELMNDVGELVLVRNEVMQLMASEENPIHLAAMQRLNQVTVNLQANVMRTRMQTLDQVWNKLPRVVRDLTHGTQKQVKLETEGGGTELDRSLLEAIKNPITHLVRNAVDHGIETQVERRRVGKAERGSLRLRAFHEGGQVNLEIVDDGRGIDPRKVASKALSKGLVTAEEIQHWSDRQILSLIFLPGLSTAESVTSVSGRGVGMDVVKTEIEGIGGTVDVHSEVGRGTTFRIRIPLTLAIIPALLVSDGGTRYAIPQGSLVELVRLEGNAAVQAIEYVYGAPVYRLRGALLPLVYLGELLGTREQSDGTVTSWDLNIVVMESGPFLFGLVVDVVHDTEEIVVKPLGPELGHLNVFAGATIMGDGKVALILDVAGIAARGRVVGDARRDQQELEHPVETVQESDESQILLLGVGGGQVGVPLSSVSRLETLAPERVERLGPDAYVQYRGGILPLVYVTDLLEERRQQPREGDAAVAESDELHVVVYEDAGRAVGVVVHRVIDVVSERLEVQTGGTRAGVSATAVIQGKITELLDTRQAFAAVNPAIYERASLATRGV